LDDRVAVVTGCARGTGAAVVQRFVDEGARVFGLDVLDERARKTLAPYGDRVAYRHCDVTSDDEWAAAVDDLLDRWGRVDVLVNNAAILHLATVEQTSAAEFEWVLRVNTVGPFLGIKACCPRCDARGAARSSTSGPSIRSRARPPLRRTRRPSSRSGA
jgi:3alpha(or 20beta)-hydroxysteroid dehydrogenase